ncbi:hypothetical protein CQ12_04150 [Bradyrhizobium jicamae]|uniref:O-antigen polymerase n=1 Tax=Bradyrhizobium jicamae TaxID=280332 RepID=A0A0R3KGI7_9BRAD|nr:hypothetical protein [Bradyrhizobium jicamae]KRQ94729.1 hypothetical protein CQ12_04150 [Bradyrhizobium jicamae]
MIEPAAATWIAIIVVLAWPMVAFALYSTKPPAEATLWTILGGLLLLPATFAMKIPMIPALDKTSVPSLCAFVAYLFFVSRSSRTSSRFGSAELFAGLYVLGPVLTSVFNNDVIFVGTRILPGVGLYDGVSALLSQLIILIPFFIGRRLLQRSSDTEAILKVLAIAGLLYSIPMLIEIRMSPQLSNWIYGFFPSTGMAAEARYGGFRPVVFMANGLAAAFFMATSFLAATALWRARTAVTPVPPAAVSGYLAIVIVLCKSAGALTYTVLGGLLVRLVTPRVQLRIGALLVGVGLLYPVLRVTDLFPDHAVLEVSSLFSQERAESLRFRFDQENHLLDRAMQRPLLGWGRYGRSRVYDDDSGTDTSFTDGAWIITLGQFGLLGFLAQFSLLALPVFRALSAYKNAESEKDRIYLAALVTIIALTFVEQLPNSSISSWSWLLVGALLGRTEYLKANARRGRRFRDTTGVADARLRLLSDGR